MKYVIIICDHFYYVNFFFKKKINCNDFFLIQFLGCQSLNESIEEQVNVSGNIRETGKSRDLQKNLRERAHVFYYNYPKHVIRRNEERLKKLKVEETDKIEIKYSLKTKNNDQTKPITAHILEDEGTLYMTSNQDYLDISRCLVKYIYKSHKPRDIEI